MEENAKIDRRHSLDEQHDRFRIKEREEERNRGIDEKRNMERNESCLIEQADSTAFYKRRRDRDCAQDLKDSVACHENLMKKGLLKNLHGKGKGYAQKRNH